MLIEIDVWLLGKLERFSHWFQKLTGKNCFWLAKIAAIFHGLLIVVILMSGVFLGNQAIAIVSGIMVTFAFFVVFKHFALIKHRERVVLSTQEKSLSNPFKVLDYDCRAMVLFIILLCFFYYGYQLDDRLFSVLLQRNARLSNVLAGVVILFLRLRSSPAGKIKS